MNFYYNDKSKPFISILESLRCQQRQQPTSKVSTEETEDKKKQGEETIHHQKSVTFSMATAEPNDIQPSIASSSSSSAVAVKRVLSLDCRPAVPAAAPAVSAASDTLRQQQKKKDDEPEYITVNLKKTTTSTTTTSFQNGGSESAARPHVDIVNEGEQQQQNPPPKESTAVGTSDDPFHTRFAELVQAKECLLQHQIFPTQERRLILEDLQTLQKSLNLLRTMHDNVVVAQKNGGATTTDGDYISVPQQAAKVQVVRAPSPEPVPRSKFLIM